MSDQDLATSELAQAIDTSNSLQQLWIADEHPLPDHLLHQLAGQNVYLISNRYDQVKRAKDRGVRAAFNDFDLQHPEQKLWDRIYFRVAKEKAVVHHIINSAADTLRDKGTLWLAGHKKEGTKTYLSKAEDRFGCKAMVKRGKDQLYVGHLDLYQKNPPLPDDDYHDLRLIPMSESESFWSKPGLYGWNRIDKGSQFLAENLEGLNISLAESRILDLGCGYGYLSCKAIELGAKVIVATDNCAAAVLACNKNMEPLKTQGDFTCSADDCGDGISGKFDLILCNPPFHAGFSISSELHQRFVQAIRNKLADKGQALVVVNQFLRLQNICEENGLEIVERIRDNQRHFDLYRLQHRR